MKFPGEFNQIEIREYSLLWHEFFDKARNILMSRRKSKDQDKKTDELRDEATIGGNLPGRNTSEKADIEQTRIENRREADLEDKTPGGDGGPEDNPNERQVNDPMGESNY